MERNRNIQRHLKEHWEEYERIYREDYTEFYEVLIPTFFENSDLWENYDSWFDDKNTEYLDIESDWYDLTKEQFKERIDKIYNDLKEYKGEDEDDEY